MQQQVVCLALLDSSSLVGERDSGLRLGSRAVSGAPGSVIHIDDGVMTAWTQQANRGRPWLGVVVLMHRSWVLLCRCGVRSVGVRVVGLNGLENETKEQVRLVSLTFRVLSGVRSAREKLPRKSSQNRSL